MTEVQKEKAKKVVKETVKIGIAVAAGVVAYKLYENYKDSQGLGALDIDDNAAGCNTAAYSSICNLY